MDEVASETDYSEDGTPLGKRWKWIVSKRSYSWRLLSGET